MISKENINYSLRNIRASKSRSLLTVFSILIGIATLFIFVSFGLGLYQYIDEITSSSSANKILVQSKGGTVPGLSSSFPLTDNDIKALKKTPGVSIATGLYIKSAEIKQDSTKKYVFITSYDPDYPIIIELSNVEIIKGRDLRRGDSKKVVLGYNYLIEDKIFPKSYDVGNKINIQGIDLSIVGFFEEIGNPQDDSNIYITNDYYEELFPDTTSYGMLLAEGDAKDMDNIVEKAEQNLRRARGLKEGKEDFVVQSYQELLDSYLGAMNIVIGFIILIALISVLVSSVNTANTMITSVLERYKEIGVLKAIGARNSEIFKIFLFESSLLGFVAGAVGVFCGWVFTSIAKIILVQLGWSFLSPSYPIYLFVGCILFATITGAVSGVFPAINASKTNTVDALRYE